MRKGLLRAGGLVSLVAAFGLLVRPALAQLDELSISLDVQRLAVAADDQGRAVFDCPGAQWLGQTGEPDLPWQVLTVLLPPDARLDTVRGQLQGAVYESIEGAWSVAPVPMIATWDGSKTVVISPADKNMADGRALAIYGQDAFWPAEHVRVLHTGRLRKWRLAEVAVPLARFNPVTGSLSRLVGGNVVVSFARAKAGQAALSPAELADRIGEDAVQRIAVNFAEQKSAYDPALDGGGKAAGGKDADPGYVIVTRSAIASSSTELSNFVAHKQIHGYNAQVVNETQWGGGDGNTAAENIRAWLQSHYVSDNIEYVLLIGDPSPGTGNVSYKVPMKMLWPRHNDDSYKEAPSDYYYADLTGNWDRDADGYYGEWGDDFGSGGVDRHWEVLVGRIPCYGSSYVAAVDAILRKTIDYEMDAAADWRKSTLLPMEPSDSSTPGYHLGEQIKTHFLVPQGWSYHRIYESTYGLNPPPETTPCNMTNVTSVWSANPFGLVVWWTHGSSTTAADVMDIWHVPSLNDDYPAFTFQVSCHNGYPETTNNLAYELLKHGAVSTVAASRVSWYYVGQIDFAGSTSNSGLSYEYTGRVVQNNDSTGLALHDVKQVLSPDASALWMNFCVFNIYGDPSVAVISPHRVHNVTRNLWYPAIQPALDAAYAGDEIVLMPMVYRGDYNTDLDFAGKSLKLRGLDPTDPAVVANTVIDCQGAGRAFDFDSGESPTAVIAGLTIINAGDGAIVCANNSRPSVVNCVIAGNAGGGIRCGAGCVSRINNCVITRNSASSPGGGVCCLSGAAPVITNCTIFANSAPSGGGIYVSSGASPTLANCIVWGNSAGQVSGPASPTYCCIQDWSAGGQGNIGDDPLFVDPDGPDDNPATWQDNNLTLPQASPCVNAGGNAALARDLADLDQDGRTTEDVPFDLLGQARVAYGKVDMGAYEFIVRVAPDLDADGDVDQDDFGQLQVCLSGAGTAQTSPECQVARLDTDSDVDQDDIYRLLGCKAGADVVPNPACDD